MVRPKVLAGRTLVSVQKTTTRRGIGLPGLILALYLHAGAIKENPLLSWIPVDLTLLLAVVLAMSVVGAILRSGFIPHAIWMPVLIAAVMSIGILPGAQNAYGEGKIEAFFTLTLLGMFAAAVLLNDPRQVRSFLKTLAGLGVLVSLLVTLMPARVSEWSNVVTLAGTNTIATSRMILSGAIVIILVATLKKMSKAKRVGLALLSALMIITALNTGSRGPILAAGMAVTLALLFAPVFARRRGRTIFAFVLIAGAGSFLAFQSGKDGLGRILSFLGGEGDASSGARAQFWEFAWYYALETPTGLGWGAFASIPAAVGAFVVEGAVYPHNMVIEIALEAGLFAAATISIILLVSLFRMRSLATTPATVVIFALLIFTSMNSMLSGDINDNRLMWALIVAAWAIKRTKVTVDEDGDVAPKTAARSARR